MEKNSTDAERAIVTALHRMEVQRILKETGKYGWWNRLHVPENAFWFNKKDIADFLEHVDADYRELVSQYFANIDWEDMENFYVKFPKIVEDARKTWLDPQEDLHVQVTPNYTVGDIMAKIEKALGILGTEEAQNPRVTIGQVARILDLPYLTVQRKIVPILREWGYIFPKDKI